MKRFKILSVKSSYHNSGNLNDQIYDQTKATNISYIHQQMHIYNFKRFDLIVDNNKFFMGVFLTLLLLIVL